MEPMKSVLSTSLLAWVRRLAIAFLAFVAVIAIAFTAFELFDAGPAGLAELGFDNFTYAWPTVLALALVIGEPHFLRGLHWRQRSVSVAAMAWLGSALVYARDFPNVSVRDTVAVLIIAGSPVLVVYTWRLILARTSMRPGLQLGATVVAALVLVWLTVPMALVVGCAVAGACP
jgi:hypothetical protein